MAVHEILKLYITSEKFIIEPDNGRQAKLLVIDRVTQDIFLQEKHGQISASAITKQIYGIMGIIKLIAGAYLIVITKRYKVGGLMGHTVWRVGGTELLCYKRSTSHLTEQQITLNKMYMSMVNSVLESDSFYFSTSYDISHCLQRLHNASPDFTSLALHERADERFVWNSYILKDLTQQAELKSYCIPVILGCGKSFDYVLISRRCIFRAGTRFNTRGVDNEGQVANFVETEQIVQYEGRVCSFVQTRGSIPVFWTQRANLQRLPCPTVLEENHLSGFQRHFSDQLYYYGLQVIVNLVNHSGMEHIMEKTFARTVGEAQNKSIKYESFDFHKECQGMRFDRVAALVRRLENDRKQLRYFCLKPDGSAMMEQVGVFRVNCMDCLDRTNVVQGLLALESLQDQLMSMDVLVAGQRLEDQKQFDVIFRNVWADNADALSKQYAGTGALKTDFTRTGKRTFVGVIMDGWLSSLRYVRNNFQDGHRQDAIDVFLGNYVVEETEGLSMTSALSSQRGWKFFALPVVSLIALTMTIFSLLQPGVEGSEQMMYVLFWMSATVITVAMIFRFGSTFVDHPRLLMHMLRTE